MWSRRAQEYDQKINSGKIYELAEVVKDLNKNTDIIADQSYSERQIYLTALSRLTNEYGAVQNLEKKIAKSKLEEGNVVDLEHYRMWKNDRKAK